jgi:hypothetical protein
MAVRNEYINADTEAGKLVSSAFGSEGTPVICMVQTFETEAADDAGSIYRLFKNLDPNLIPVKIEIACDAIAGATDMDLGLYENLDDGGAVVDQDILMASVNLSAGYLWAAAKDGLVTVGVEKVGYNLAELVGHTLITRKRGYDLVLTADSEITAAGTISVRAYFIQG